MRKVILAVALLTLARCDGVPTAQGSTRGGRDLVPNSTAPATLVDPAPMAVVSVRRWVTGLYITSGQNTSGGDIHLIVRRNSGAMGFQSLTSGSLVQDEYRLSGEEMSFSAEAGYRYLVIAAPVVNGADDMQHATYAEFVP